MHKTQSRHPSFHFSHSFNSRYKTTLSRGTIDPTTSDGLYDNIQYADGTEENVAEKVDGAGVAGEAPAAPALVPAPPPPPPAAGQIESQRIESVEKGRNLQERAEGQRKKGVLRKLHLHKS